MKLFDIALKNAIAKTSTTFPLADVGSLASKLQIRCDYLLQVFSASIDVQRALRNAIASDSQTFPQYVVASLNVLLSLPFTGILPTSRLVAPVTLPSATITVLDARDFPISGKLLINATNFSQIVSYTGKSQPAGHFGTFTGCQFVSGFPGGNTGQGAVSLIAPPGLDLSASAVRARRSNFFTAFSRRSGNTIAALSYITDQHVYEDPLR